MKTFSLTFLMPGDKVLIVHRRLFEKDSARFFLGQVEAFNETNGLLKIAGHTIGPSRTGGLAKKKDRTVKIMSLTAGSLIVYVLEPSVDLSSAEIRTGDQGQVVLRDAKHKILDLSESIAG